MACYRIVSSEEIGGGVSGEAARERKDRRHTRRHAMPDNVLEVSSHVVFFVLALQRSSSTGEMRAKHGRRV